MYGAEQLCNSWGDFNPGYAASYSVHACGRWQQLCAVVSMSCVVVADILLGPPASCATHDDLCCRLHGVCCRHATSIDEDEQLLSDAGRLPPRLQAALQARLERKQLLVTAQQMLTLYARELE
jgi:hypothetical protein